MSSALPGTLFRSKRGLCPGCGSPLPLDDDLPAIVCPFCGQDAVLERRLRKVEPEVAETPPRLFADAAAAEVRAEGSAAPWLRSPRFRQAVVPRAVCPGCGDEAPVPGEEATVTCRSCGTAARWERRLRTPPPDPAREVPRPRGAGERGTGRDDDDADPATEQLVHRLVTEEDPVKRTLLALRLEEWTHANPTLARLLPALLASMKSAPAGLQKGLCTAVSHLLCSGEKGLRNATLRAAERVVFDADAPEALVLELGLGDATSLKLLLDVAEVATRRGNLRLAGTAILGVDRLFERNWGQHPVMGSILLYRMLYLHGPVLAYAFLIAQRQRIGFFFPAEMLLSFIDDAAVERPGLVPELEKCFYVGLPAGEDEYRVRRLVWDGLLSNASRKAALLHYLRPPEEAPGDVYRDHAALLLSLLDDGELRDAAEDGLEKLVSLPSRVPEAVHELVRSRGDALPAEVRRAYLRAVPDTPHLSRASLPSWTPPPDPGLSPELRASRELWNEALARAVEADLEGREAWRALRAAAEGRDEPLFAPA